MLEHKRIYNRFSQLIAAPSISSNTPDLDQSNEGVIHLLVDWCSALGFDCNVQEVKPRKYNLIATMGHGNGGLIFSGHTDTVPCDEELWTSDPFALTERDNRWYGLGVIDMKGFFPLVLEALAAFDLNQLKKPVTIIATCDEESSMSGARAISQMANRLGVATVIGEPTGLTPIRGHKGVMMERFRILGQSGHSSDPSLGNNAIDAMTLCLTALKELRMRWMEEHRNTNFLIPYPTMNFGCIHGGDNPNRICGNCEVLFDVRTIPNFSAAEVRQAIKSVVAPICDREGVDFELTELCEPVPSFEVPETAKLLHLTESVTSKKSTTVAFGTEAPFFSAVSDEVVILGAGSIDVAHQPDEFLDLQSLPKAIALYQKLIAHYCFE